MGLYQCSDELLIRKDGKREWVPGAVLDVPFPSVIARELEGYVNQHDRPALPWLVALLEGNQDLARVLCMAGGFGDSYHRVLHFCRQVLPKESWGTKERVANWLQQVNSEPSDGYFAGHGSHDQRPRETS